MGKFDTASARRSRRRLGCVGLVATSSRGDARELCGAIEMGQHRPLGGLINQNSTVGICLANKSAQATRCAIGTMMSPSSFLHDGVLNANPPLTL